MIIFFEIWTAIFWGVAAGWMGITEFARGIGYGLAGGLVALLLLPLVYVVINLGFRIHKALQ